MKWKDLFLYRPIEIVFQRVANRFKLTGTSDAEQALKQEKLTITLAQNQVKTKKIHVFNWLLK